MAVERGDGQPIFRSIFGESWKMLPPVFKAHYANRPFCEDVTLVRGTMYVRLSGVYRLASPIFHLTKTLVPRSGEKVDVTVRFKSESDSRVFRFEREFVFPDGKSYRFVSRMEPVGNNEVVEWTGSGIGWHAAYSYRKERVLLEHIGYRFKLFGFQVRLPLTFVLGMPSAEEQMIDDKSFSMQMQIHNPIFGKVYSYGGTFRLVEQEG